MKEMSEYDTTAKMALLAVGEPGARKTTSILSAFPNCYIADCDNNLAGPVRFLREKGITFKYDVINEDCEPHLRHKKMLNCVETAFKDDWVQTVVVDSATSVTDYIIDRLLAEQGRKAMQQQDWGTFLGFWKHLVVAAKTYGKNFVLTCHLRPEKDEVSGLVKYHLAIPGQFGVIAGSLFSDVWLFYVEEKAGNHIGMVRTQPGVRHALKCSLKLPASFEFNPKLIRDAMS